MLYSGKLGCWSACRQVWAKDHNGCDNLLGGYTDNLFCLFAQSMVLFGIVYCSCLVDREEPIEEWMKIHNQQEEVCDFLNQASSIHMVGEDTDLTFNVEGRKWINSDGKKNMPSGEVFTAPIENSANGTIRFTYPGIYAGKEVEDIMQEPENSS